MVEHPVKDFSGQGASVEDDLRVLNLLVLILSTRMQLNGTLQWSNRFIKHLLAGRRIHKNNFFG